MHPSSNPACQLQTTLFKSKREHEDSFVFQDIERQLLAIDENTSREASKSKVHFKQTACVAVANGNGNHTRSDKFKTINKFKRNDKGRTSGKTLDKSKIKCYNCNKFGHFSKECSSPRRPRNNNFTSGSANLANQSSTNTPAASTNNNNGQRTVHTACTAGVHNEYYPNQRWCPSHK